MKTFERAGDMKMRPRHWLVLLMVIGIASGPAYALTVGDAIVAIADNVSESQQQDGSWHSEEAYTGSIITGLLSAARQTGLPPHDPKYQTYLSSARLGGFYLVEAAQGFYFGEEVFALSDSQEITYFRGLAARFFQRAKEVDTTPGYIAAFDDLGPSTLVQGLAWYVIAAWKTDAADKWIWRQALIDAMAAWSGAVQITWREVALVNRNVAVDWAYRTGDHSAFEPAEAGDPDCPFDGAGGTIAHAGFPPA